MSVDVGRMVKIPEYVHFRVAFARGMRKAGARPEEIRRALAEFDRQARGRREKVGVK
jgi:hypothetical protein